MAKSTDHRIHVNIQIEGATNSSFLNELGSIYGSDHVLVYKVSDKKFIRLSDLYEFPGASLLKIGKEILSSTPLFNQGSADSQTANDQMLTRKYSRSELPPDTRVVHGHFTPSLFQGILDNPFISIVLKDPLERMITLYLEWQESKGETDWRIKIPFDSKLTFRDFSAYSGMANFQSKSLGSKRLGDFDLVGVAECQPGFIAQLKNKEWTGYINLVDDGYQLDKPRYKKLGIDPEFLADFQLENELDYAIYQQAKEFIGYCK